MNHHYLVLGGCAWVCAAHQKAIFRPPHYIDQMGLCFWCRYFHPRRGP